MKIVTRRDKIENGASLYRMFILLSVQSPLEKWNTYYDVTCISKYTTNLFVHYYLVYLLLRSRTIFIADRLQRSVYYLLENACQRLPK